LTCMGGGVRSTHTRGRSTHINYGEEHTYREEEEHTYKGGWG